jgi:hypothetical protein
LIIQKKFEKAEQAEQWLTGQKGGVTGALAALIGARIWLTREPKTYLTDFFASQ